ncbi:hypothetical protein HC891_08135 [Candidatus Gracilibacteria bacterium]|nr:hypothetical protein [Candidatus Gracilibacteria bacterium]
MQQTMLSQPTVAPGALRRLLPWMLYPLSALLLLIVLLLQPDLDLRLPADPEDPFGNPFHFWIITAAGLLALTIGALMGEAATRRADARVLLLSLAVLGSAAAVLIHALATPNVIVQARNVGFVIAAPVGLVIAGFFCAVAALDLSPAQAQAGSACSPCYAAACLRSGCSSACSHFFSCRRLASSPHRMKLIRRSSSVLSARHRCRCSSIRCRLFYWRARWATRMPRCALPAATSPGLHLSCLRSQLPLLCSPLSRGMLAWRAPGISAGGSGMAGSLAPTPGSPLPSSSSFAVKVAHAPFSIASTSTRPCSAFAMSMIAHSRRLSRIFSAASSSPTYHGTG